MRRGLSLLEVLFSIFIIGVGLVGFALLIPLGTHHANQSEDLDRAVSVGNAALREIEARGILDSADWREANGNRLPRDTPLELGTFILDPILIAHHGTQAAAFPYDSGATLTMPRRSLPAFAEPPPPPSNPLAGSPMELQRAESLFMSGDDLAFAPPGNDPEARPQAVLTRDANGNILSHGSGGRYSWIAMISPAASENVGANTSLAQKRLFKVSVIVFAGRVVRLPPPPPPLTLQDLGAERQFTGTLSTGEPKVRVVGNGLDLRTEAPDSLGAIRDNQWIMLSGRQKDGRAYHAWYRVVSVGNTDNSTQRVFLTLAGPDWPLSILKGDTAATICDGVAGVFERTVSR